ncbi:MAG: 1-acyl-sn-glycerol-3-phosphate acyltransferase [Agarilytica sp.]
MISAGSQRVNYWWRVFATGLSFAVFGLGGPIIAGTLALVLLVIPMSEQRRCELSRNTIRSAFRRYIQFMKACGLLTYEIQGAQHMPQGGQLVIANHPSLLDVVFLMALIDGSNCIVRDGLLRNRFTRSPISAARFIRNNDPNLVENSKASLARKERLIIFPEGTRSRPGEPYKFQRGAANIALHAQCDIAPVLINCSPATLMKHQKWYNIPYKPPHFVIAFQSPFDIAPYANQIDNDVPQCKVARQLTRDLVSYYKEKTQAFNEAIYTRSSTSNCEQHISEAT